MTLATSYAFGDVFRIRHSLHRSWRESKPFYASFTGLVVLAAAIVLIPNAPLGVITTAVQALAGLLLPSASVFLLLLCNDPAVLGPWVNRPWLNALASVILAVLLELSLVLVVTTIFPAVDMAMLLGVLSGALASGLLVMGGLALVGRRHAPAAAVDRSNREDWRMPPIALLSRPVWSRARQLAMYSLSGYLVVTILLLFVRAAEIVGGH